MKSWRHDSDVCLSGIYKLMRRGWLKAIVSSTQCNHAPPSHRSISSKHGPCHSAVRALHDKPAASGFVHSSWSIMPTAVS